MMADFVQTMKNWCRMCKFFTELDVMPNDTHGCIDMCPLGHSSACGDLENATDNEIKDAAKSIERWAAEHPEPVYPTWGTWLATEFDHDLREIMYEPIPADIAQKLGIEPENW